MSILPMERVKSRLVVCLLAGVVASCGVGAIGCGIGRSSDRASSEAAATPPPAAPKTDDERPKIVALGDSLTAGLGLLDRQSYPRLLQEKIDRDGFNYEVVNAGVSGD